MTDRNYYGLNAEHDKHVTDLRGDYFFAWTWRDGQYGITWVNWFICYLYSDAKELARRDTVSFPPSGDDALPFSEWRRAEFVAHGFLKWDGCAQWECDAHLDGRDLRRAFFDAVDWAHYQAAMIMSSTFDKEVDNA